MLQICLHRYSGSFLFSYHFDGCRNALNRLRKLVMTSILYSFFHIFGFLNNLCIIENTMIFSWSRKLHFYLEFFLCLFLISASLYSLPVRAKVCLHYLYTKLGATQTLIIRLRITKEWLLQVVHPIRRWTKLTFLGQSIVRKKTEISFEQRGLRLGMTVWNLIIMNFTSSVRNTQSARR